MEGKGSLFPPERRILEIFKILQVIIGKQQGVMSNGI